MQEIARFRSSRSSGASFVLVLDTDSIEVPSVGTIRARYGIVRRSHSRNPFMPAARVAWCFLSVLLSVVAVGLFGRGSDGANIIWLSNGLLLAYLLIVPRWRWPRYLAASAAGMILGSAIIHENWRMSLLFNALNLVETGTAALLLRRRSIETPRFTDGRYLARFALYGVLLGPLVAGLAMTLISVAAWHQQPLPTLLRWLATDSVGIAVTTPIFVAIFQNSLRNATGRRRPWIFFLLFIVVTSVVFLQSQVPILFVILPCLLLVQLRLGLGWAAVGTVFISLTGGTMTARGFGPLSNALGVSESTRPLLLQLFIISAVVMMYCVSVVLENEKTIERRLQEIVSIHRLIAENSRDVILLADFDGRPSYVSPAVRSMGGWQPENLMKMESLDLVHPEDRDKVADALRAMRSGLEGARIEHRALKQNGDYIWVESSLRTIRNPNTHIATGVLDVVRDISERKQVEKELEAAYRTVEALAVEDSLTGLANRRRLDESLVNEWRRGLRDGEPLSFLLIDVDHFKSYNDTYGHVFGDRCLKQIAEVAMSVVSRPGDLAARYGGEEFAIVLPRTDKANALVIANEICAALRSCKLTHRSNPEGFVTISIGCATLVPTADLTAGILIDLADKALYEAKGSGRNRVGCADAAVNLYN